MRRDQSIQVACGPGEIRVAVTSDGNLCDYALSRPGSPDGVGDIFRARVCSVVPAMAGAFLELGNNVSDGFLPDSEGGKGLTVGSIVTVRVTRAALGGKGPRLTARDVAAQDGPVGLRARGPDPLRELAARYPEAKLRVDDALLAASLRADLGERVERVAVAFDDVIESDLEQLAAPEITLGSGARLSFYPTPALVAIDVDAGHALAGKEAAARWHRALNSDLLPELARQIRLRDLSGAIVVDLAGLKPRQRVSLGPAIASALACDPLRPRFLGFTALGLAEITRPRIRPPLHEKLSGPLAAGLRGLREIAHGVRSDPGRRVALRASPSVVAALDTDRVGLDELARILGQGLKLRSDPSLPGEVWRIEAVDG
jgi:Ribonuclease G/E